MRRIYARPSRTGGDETASPNSSTTLNARNTQTYSHTFQPSYSHVFVFIVIIFICSFVPFASPSEPLFFVRQIAGKKRTRNTGCFSRCVILINWCANVAQQLQHPEHMLRADGFPLFLLTASVYHRPPAVHIIHGRHRNGTWWQQQRPHTTVIKGKKSIQLQLVKSDPARYSWGRYNFRVVVNPPIIKCAPESDDLHPLRTMPLVPCTFTHPGLYLFACGPQPCASAHNPHEGLWRSPAERAEG